MAMLQECHTSDDSHQILTLTDEGDLRVEGSNKCIYVSYNHQPGVFAGCWPIGLGDCGPDLNQRWLAAQVDDTVVLMEAWSGAKLTTGAPTSGRSVLACNLGMMGSECQPPPYPYTYNNTNLMLL